ncbi:zinc finger protein 595-like isoform X1 [Toxorhynchites rutilus septentrionalis]|uniref:zinc finger protein 595-like isoform X1 n=1 Tax=Toxorhynchites rutilus septentrionalis TaxID=329112 RepID=UPI00247A50F2|nr:zinc finger protein 595-like isoform X1 [Toxorhynchites rutilus septentrionalis]
MPSGCLTYFGLFSKKDMSGISDLRLMFCFPRSINVLLLHHELSIVCFVCFLNPGFQKTTSDRRIDLPLPGMFDTDAVEYVQENEIRTSSAGSISFACEDCGKAFRLESSYNRHMAVVHKQKNSKHRINDRQQYYYKRTEIPSTGICTIIPAVKQEECTSEQSMIEVKTEIPDEADQSSMDEVAGSDINESSELTEHSMHSLEESGLQLKVETLELPEPNSQSSFLDCDGETYDSAIDGRFNIKSEFECTEAQLQENESEEKTICSQSDHGKVGTSPLGPSVTQSDKSEAWNHDSTVRIKVESDDSNESDTLLTVHSTAEEDSTASEVNIKEKAPRKHCCVNCDKIFFHRSKLITHRAKVHGMEEMDAAPLVYTCEICDKVYHTKDGLAYHRSVHPEYQKFKCDVCQEAFAYERNLKYHKQRLHGEAKFTCESCGKSFKTKAYLRTHLNIHQESKSYKCAFCEKTFAQYNGRATHVKRMHPEQFEEKSQRELTCEICHKKLDGKFRYSVHMKNHTLERKFLCSHCDSSFVTKQALSRHQRIHTKKIMSFL